MSKKIVVLVLFMLVSWYGVAQKSINDYKYIIVPQKFDFFNTEDQYQLNSLTKFLFNKYGYEAFFAGDVDEFPEDLKKNHCLALTAEVTKDKGGIFKTKLLISLKDCYGVTVMTSQIGESRVKEYKKAYNLALRDAFVTFQNFNYKYVPKADVMVKPVNAETGSVNESTIKVATPENKIVETTKTEEVESVKTEVVSTTHDFSDLHYAQEIKNGFQLVNSEPKIVMILLSTAAENVFIVKGKSAIVFKEDGFWYYSENNGELGDKTAMNIKF
ncbi:hypothetical protein VDP25_13045 [Winogradskyella sp. ECml5-4]|uniref:hypothetical protein n=1 Tax=Winogradskyella sp. ECml5-4 TaxID=3110975 RepID=UPI002FEEFF0A